MEMNEKFLELPEEKKLKIINASFEVFSQNDYKHASTENIAAKAGISKGLLFYYFQNKRMLYTFLFELANNQVLNYVVDSHMCQITDFFELCEYAGERKYQMMQKSPYIMDFIVRAFYSQHETVSEDINKKVESQTSAIYGTYFRNIDLSKFRDDVNPKDIYQMLTWMADGYMHDRQRTGQCVELDDMMEKFRLWSTYLKKMSYKEKYLI